MDHLPAVTARSPPIEAPYYGGVYDDKGDWKNFPKRTGWDLEALENNNKGSHTKSELIQLLQTWCYLGLLCAITDSKFATIEKQFIIHGRHGRRGSITSKHLPHVLVKARLRENGRCDTIRFCVDRVRGLARAYRLPIELVLPMDLLFEALQGAAETRHWAQWTTLQSVPFLIDQNASRGDCIGLTSAIADFGVSGLYLRYLLGKPASDHDHSKCDEKRCIAYKNDSKDYRTTPAKDCPKINVCCTERRSHAKQNAGCGMIAVDYKVLFNILRSGTFPLVSIHLDHGKPRVKLSPYEAGIEYIALSHVIADGMGNFTANALPECRLLDLYWLLDRFCAQVHASNRVTTFFWLDTLCVPIKTDSYRKERDKAMSMMASSYANAKIVLALDAELRQIAPNSHLEAAIWVIRSAWATRYWTLQEVILTRQSFVQFQEKAWRLYDIMENVKWMMAKQSGLQWCRAITGIFERLFVWTRWNDISKRAIEKCSNYQQYTFLMIALTGRSLSKLSDEAACLASILDGPGSQKYLERIVTAPAERKMLEFWSHQSQVPLGLIFIHGPRLPNEGFGWALSSVLGLKEAGNTLSNLRMSEECGKVKDGGLLFTCQGFHFKLTDKVIKDTFRFRVRNEKSTMNLAVYLGRPRLDSIRLDLKKSLAILLPPDNLSKPRLPITPHKPFQSVGLPGTELQLHQYDFVQEDMTFVALLNVVSSTNKRIKAKHLGVFLAIAPDSFSLVDGSTLQDVNLVNSEWLIE